MERKYYEQKNFLLVAFFFTCFSTSCMRVFASFSLKSDSFKNFFDFISALYKVFFLFWIIFFLSNLIYCLCS